MDYKSLVILTTMLPIAGCSIKPYTQTQIAYARGHHKQDQGHHVNLICSRSRVGGKAVTGGEFRLGVDVCYGKLPPSTSESTYSIDVPIVGRQQAEVDGATNTKLVRITFPFLEYKYGSLEANIPSAVPQNIGLRSPFAKDISLGMWAALGYSLDIALSETDYLTEGGSFNDVPGIKIGGKFYSEFNNEITLFGRIPLNMSLRLDQDGKVTPGFGAGYRIQW